MPAYNKNNALKEVFQHLLKKYRKQRSDPNCIQFETNDDSNDAGKIIEDETAVKKIVEKDSGKKVFEMEDLKPYFYPVSK